MTGTILCICYILIIFIITVSKHVALFDARQPVLKCILILCLIFCSFTDRCTYFGAVVFSSGFLKCSVSVTI